VVVLPAGINTEEGATSPLPLSLTMLTVRSPAALATTTVQLVVAPAASVGPAQVREAMAGAASNEIAVVFEPPFNVAVTVAVPSDPGRPATTGNLPLLDPEGTVTVAGTLRSGVLLARETTAPSGGAALLNVNVQSPCPPVGTLPGVQPRDATVTGPEVNVNARETPLAVAVSTTVPPGGTGPMIASKPATLEPDGTVIAGGTATPTPPVAVSDTETGSFAGLVNLTVQLTFTPGFRYAGVQTTESRPAGPSRLKTILLDVPPQVAVKVADWSAPTLASRGKCPTVEPPGIVTTGGTLSAGLSLLRVTVMPVTGAGMASSTEQLAKAPETILFEPHEINCTFDPAADRIN